ncbi:MAG: GNAT family N-acetyltransferase [Fimbriimonadaceae bacterium]|nr:GNAT family N-acetyltransferase [Fimbriimonadaceae bacterium]
MEFFETDRLIARTWTLDDAESAFLMYGNPVVMRYLGANGAAATIPSIEAMRERLQQNLDKYATDPELHGYVWAALERKSDGVLVGTTLLKPIPFSDEIPATDIEVGWHLIPEYWGNGYATESGRGAIDYGFQKLGLSEIHSVAYAENAASIKVMDRLGLRHLGKTSIYYNVEVEHFVITRDEWER